MKKSFTKITLAAAVAVFAAPVFAATYSDAQVAEIMDTANEGEISLADVAITRAQNGDVKAFAEKMQTEHRKNEKEVEALAKKAKLGMADSDHSTKLTTDAKASIVELNAVPAADFDRSYMASQVKMHETLLNTIETALLPSVKNATLRTYLDTTKNHVRAHLAEAKRIQNKL